ncbi:unnamed protein product [Arabidopsis lyrata]|nr:unnamed protein product [Arabidopsis lyrata]
MLGFLRKEQNENFGDFGLIKCIRVREFILSVPLYDLAGLVASPDINFTKQQIVILAWVC